MLLLLHLALLLATCMAPAVGQDLQWLDNCEKNLSGTAGVRENLPIGTVVCRLSAAYRNSTADVVYAISSDYFSVNETAGVVAVKKPMDREEFSQTDITVTARYPRSSPPAEIAVTLKVNVQDVNDNAPKFTNLPYASEVSESELPGKVFFTGVRVLDNDRNGDNVELDIVCYPPISPVCSLFNVTQQKLAHANFSASLVLNATVDFEVSPFYIVTLMASDRGTPRLNQTVNMIVTVIDAQDTPPRFRSDFNRFAVVENTTVTSTVGMLEARDGDGGEDLGRPVVIEIVDDPLGVFEMAPTQDPVRGSVYYRADLRFKAGRSLDREASHGGFYYLNVSATELVSATNRTKTKDSVTTRVEIVISDINDNVPTFVNGPVYNVTVVENLANRSVVPDLDILVRDADGTSKNNKMSLRVVSSTFPSAFTINPENIVGEGSCNLLVADASKLDYEVAAYRSQMLVLELKERDTTQLYSSTATVYVTLADSNDHSPEFVGNRSFFQVEVREDRPVGWIVSSDITARDLDSGSYGNVTYSLSGTDASSLAVNSTSGQLTLAKPLDYETQKELSVTITATDGGGLSAAAVVYVRVTNFNDKAPLFRRDRYITTLREESTALIPPLVLETNDSDSTAPIKFSIISGNTPDNAFAIVNQKDNNLNGQLLINRTQGFNYSETPSGSGVFVLRVLAEDDGVPALNSTTIVEIRLLDINNHAPVFSPRNYSATIPETAIQGRLVAKVTATDEDVDPASNKKITYQLQAGRVDKFTISELTGEIFVAKTNSFDVDAEGTLYFLQVVARDEGSPSRSDVATVLVTVTDANNKNPVFGQTLYIFSIGEDIAAGSLVGSVNATDMDSNSDLEFSFRDGDIVAWSPLSNRVTSRSEFDYVAALRMSANGSIFTQLAMNRDVVAEMQLTAVVRDRNAERPAVQTATATVVVKIDQRSVRKPVFSPPWTPTNPQISVSLPEGLPAGSTVITLAASDPSSKEKVSKFKIVTGSNSESAFSIDETLGTVRLTKVLDYEGRTSKRLTVAIEATSPSSATAVCTLIVEILDRNDNTPQFRDSSYSFTVSEDARYPQSFGMVSARDEDSGDFGTVRYSLHGTGSELFDLNAQDGTLRPAAGVTLDREAKEQFDFLKKVVNCEPCLFQVRATDSPSATSAASRRYTDVPLRITLTDTNDNAPNFTNPTFVVSIFENIPISSVIYTLTARDPDAGVNSFVTFGILAGNEKGYFSVNPSSGDLRVIASLQDKTAESPYVLTVVASDSGAPRQRSEAKLTVIVRSVLEIRGNPVVTFPTQDGVYATPEEAPVGSEFLQAKARDPDTLLGKVTFLLSGRDASKFRINATTGWISGTVRLDRETQQSFQLVVDAMDVAGLRALQPVRFTVTLSDINDNVPKFVGCRAQYDTQPVFVAAPENVVNRDVTTFTACDRDVSPNDRIRYYITCGNEDGHFAINPTTGVLQIAKAIDREKQAEYNLCILANNSLPLVGSAAGTSSVLRVRVGIEDEDDNGPTFSTASLSVYVQADSEFETDVVTVAAKDPDLPSNWKHTYEILTTTFSSKDGSKVKVDEAGAFTIDAATGTIRTHYVGYQSYIGGVFEVVVRVRDSKSRQATTTVTVNVLGDENRLRFVLTKTPVEAQRIALALLANVSSVTGAQLTFRQVAHHVTTVSGSDRSRSDLCFVVSSSAKILSLAEALSLLQLGASSTLDAVYSDYGVVSLGYCSTYALYKTYDYFGIEGYWWMFIGLSAGIIVLAAALLGFMGVLYHRFQTMCYTLQYQ